MTAYGMAPDAQPPVVDVVVPSDGRDSVILMMPIWSPGMYSLQSYGDRITIKNRPRTVQLVKLNLQESPPPVPDYLERADGEPPEGRLTRLPTRGDVDPRIQEIREQLIIEFCAR